MMKKVLSFILSLLVISTSLWAVPEITFLEPNVGLEKGGIPVKIHGSNFTGIQPGGVTVGGTPADIVSSSNTEITITLPPHVYGSALVQVTVNGETSSPNADNSDYFTYIGEKKIALASGFANSASPDQPFEALGIYKTADLQLIDLVEISTSTNGSTTNVLAITPDGSVACVLYNYNTLIAIDLLKHEVFASRSGVPGGLGPIAISVDGSRVYISSSVDNVVNSYNIPSPSDLAPAFTSGPVYTLPFNVIPAGAAVSSSTLYSSNIGLDPLTLFAGPISSPSTFLSPLNQTSFPQPGAANFQLVPDGSNAIALIPGTSVSPGSPAFTEIISLTPPSPFITVTDNQNPLGIAVAPNSQFAFIAGDLITVKNTTGTIRKLELALLNFGEPGQYESAFFPPGVNATQTAAIAMDSQIAAFVNETGSGAIFPNLSTTSGHLTPSGSSDPLLQTGTPQRGLAITPDQAPTARVVMELGPGGYESLFDASGSWSPTFSTLPSHLQPDNGISAYRWDFGDGTTLVTDHPIVKHTYAQPGSYNFSLIVENKSGTSVFQLTQGQTMLLNGGPSAQTNQSVDIFVVVPPVLTDMFPPGGLVRGGHKVSLKGTHLLTTHTVIFGDQPAEFTVISDNEVVATAPRTEMLGPVQVFVVTQGGKSNSLPHNYIPDTFSPRNFRGRQIENRFATQTERVNVLTWDVPTGEPVVTYVIFRDKDLEHAIAKIPAQNALVFEDHNRRDRPYTYYIVAINDKGEMSIPASVTVSPR